MLWFRQNRNRSIWWLIFEIRLCSRFQRHKRGRIDKSISVGCKGEFRVAYSSPLQEHIHIPAWAATDSGSYFLPGTNFP